MLSMEQKRSLLYVFKFGQNAVEVERNMNVAFWEGTVNQQYEDSLRNFKLKI